LGTLPTGSFAASSRRCEGRHCSSEGDGAFCFDASAGVLCGQIWEEEKRYSEVMKRNQHLQYPAKLQAQACTHLALGATPMPLTPAANPVT
jgi:hypothetical protein